MILISYFTKLSGILFKPLKVLEDYKSEESINEPFKFLIISSILAGIISFIFQNITGTSMGGFTYLFALSILGELIFIFILSGIFHLLVKLFKGPNPYYQTFKGFAYISAFGVVGSLIGGLSPFLPALSIILPLLSLWSLIILGSCLKHYTDLGNGELIAIGLISIMLISLILVIISILAGTMILSYLLSSFS